MAPPHSDESPVRGEVRAPGGAAEGDRRGAPGVRVPADHRGTPGDIRVPGEPEGGGAAAPAVGPALEAHGYAAEAERGPPGHRRRGSAREPAVETAEGGDRAAGGLPHGLHRARPRRWDPEGVADPHPRSPGEVRPGLRRWSVGQLRLGALGLDGGGADPGPPPELARRDHRPPGPGPGVHRLRVDRPAAVGGRAPLPCPPRTEGQPGDGELLRPVQGGEPVINYYNRVRRHSSLGDRPPLGIIEDFYREG